MIIVQVMQNMNINEEGIDTTAIIIIIWSVYDRKIFYFVSCWPAIWVKWIETWKLL